MNKRYNKVDLRVTADQYNHNLLLLTFICKDVPLQTPFLCNKWKLIENFKENI